MSRGDVAKGTSVSVVQAQSALIRNGIWWRSVSRLGGRKVKEVEEERQFGDAGRWSGLVQPYSAC